MTIGRKDQKMKGLTVCIVAMRGILILGMSSIMVRYRARVAYNGAAFAGFQLQPTQKRTVQGELETAIQQAFGIKGDRVIRVVGAGRTDAGVHARGQAVHFDGPSIASLSDAQIALEDSLPSDIVVWDLQVAPSSVRKIKNGINQTFLWNVMYDSTQKLYIYRLSLGNVMDPLEQHWRWHVPQYREVDIEEFQRILQLYVGTHDFSAFSSSNLVGSTTVRTVYSVNLVDENCEGNYRIEFLLKGALYKQVRNMVGSALEQARRAGKHRKDIDVEQLLSSGAPRQKNPAIPAPPQGLTLEHVYFDDF